MNEGCCVDLNSCFYMFSIINIYLTQTYGCNAQTIPLLSNTDKKGSIFAFIRMAANRIDRTNNEKIIQPILALMSDTHRIQYIPFE